MPFAQASRSPDNLQGRIPGDPFRIVIGPYSSPWTGLWPF